MSYKDIPLWTPPENLKKQSNLFHYMGWLERTYGLSFPDYDQLWQWSADTPDRFWETLWHYANIKTYSAYTSVMEKPPAGIIGTRWFTGARLNYAEHIFRNRTQERPAILYQMEDNPIREISWKELEEGVSAIVAFLKSKGVKPGERVVSTLPNLPETVMAFLATNAIGAVWSSCSPDFGNAGITDRFRQIEPKILFAPDGYRYNGKAYDKSGDLEALCKTLPSLEAVVVLPVLKSQPVLGNSISWQEMMETKAGPLTFEPVPFEHPIWVLYSSGTTGKPKAITHSVGGCLLEHLKTLLFHQDVKPGDRYFWYSTTGWMMWNFSVASLLAGATLVLYDGSAGYPDLQILWSLARKTGIHHFGAGAAFFIACMKAGMSFEPENFPSLRTIGSTGSPLPAQAFEWIYQSVKKEVWLISFSGGTDICSGFVGGCPLWPVYAGEIQCRLLGCYLEAFDEWGNPVRDELGEMVILAPMPSMPVYFWNDPGNTRYYSSYFEQYHGIWRHGDWIKINKRGGIVIYGRSDATLNRDGVRIGTSEIYSAVENIPEVLDSLVVCLEQQEEKYFMPLFVVLRNHKQLDDALRARIKNQLRTQYSPRHVPDAIIQVSEIPYTLSGKKMEMPVKKILMGTHPDKAVNLDTMKNPGALDDFIRLARDH